MKPQTELLLYQLLWTSDQLTRPTFRNLSSSFESWAYSSRLLRTIHRLEDEQMLQTQGNSLDQVVRLTKKGHELISGTRDPEKEWAKKWDGVWRMVLFDIPETKRALRKELRKLLRANHFGCFQQSVWISPHAMNTISKIVRKTNAGLSNFTLMESRLVAGEKNSALVEVTWDFTKINQHYDTYIQHIKNCQKGDLCPSTDRMIATEKKLWEKALKQDPLLPKKLNPQGYLGKKAYQLRKQILPKLIKTILSSKTDSPRKTTD